MAEIKKNANDVSRMRGAHKYFTDSVLPKSIQASNRKISTPTSYIHNRDETFILVRSGTGTLTVNGLDYRLSENTLINLGPFHRYRYTPDHGSTLELSESRMNSGTYVYMIANPYYKANRLEITSEPPIVQLSGITARIAAQSMDGIFAECKADSREKVPICFCYMIDLFGLVMDGSEKKFSRGGGKKKSGKSAEKTD